ncbi:hypothetical protein E1301_Tti011998 [Triplophysa tibetana]|uniref:Uncharacterized protein n=1 Tax=Triplophysa tibetana TaxID=1572043 RepID=A0A5A9PHR2_9TELE|nr:hypothetical protein E1301_Tti011998 [Triplophysa tibetana]
MGMRVRGSCGCCTLSWCRTKKQVTVTGKRSLSKSCTWHGGLGDVGRPPADANSILLLGGSNRDLKRFTTPPGQISKIMKCVALTPPGEFPSHLQRRIVCLLTMAVQKQNGLFGRRGHGLLSVTGGNGIMNHHGSKALLCLRARRQPEQRGGTLLWLGSHYRQSKQAGGLEIVTVK